MQSGNNINPSLVGWVSSASPLHMLTNTEEGRRHISIAIPHPLNLADSKELIK